MESSKVVNKILLISLAFGSATIVVGMLLAKGNFKKALLGVGATASVGSVAGFFINSQSQRKNSIAEEIELNGAPVVESGYQDSKSEQFTSRESESIKTEETNSDSLITEVEQAFNQDFEVDSVKPSPEIENEVPSLDIQEEIERSEILEQTIAPLEENIVEIEAESTTEIPLESKSFSDELIDSQSFIDTPEEAKEIIETDINPFEGSSDSSESDQNENIPDLETVDKMFGAFDQEELEAFKNQSPSEIENVTGEESDELLMEDEFSIAEDYSPVDVAEMESESESIDELPVMEMESEDEFDFGEESAIATELEPPSEVFSVDNDLDMESESVDELPMMEMESERKRVV